MLKKPNVVVIGGGTGLSSLLRGLKHFPLDINAIVTVSDNGSSTGVLRKEYDIPAPGDIRNVMVSLSKNESLIEEMLQYRFKGGSLDKHCLGNIILTGMLDITGSITNATKALSQVLDMCGKVIPVSDECVQLSARFTNQTEITGETQIVNAIKEKGLTIEEVFYKEEVLASKDAIEAIENADYIIFSIGGVYTSICSNLAIKGIREAIKNSKAEKIYTCNMMHQPGETEDYTVSDHVKAIENHLDNKIDTVFVNNNTNIPKEILNRYIEDKSDIVAIDRQHLKNHKLIEKDLLSIDENEMIRHNSLKLGMQIYAYILEKTH
jgi:uncharacterized cofD-like protein